MVSMIPFGLLAGFVEGREVRITEIDESGFCFRTIEENISDSEALKVCFYDIKNGVIVNWKFQNTIYKGLIWWTQNSPDFM